jgi:putative transposase
MLNLSPIARDISVDLSERREKIHSEHELPKTRRCELLEVARSTAYYLPEPVSEADLELMRLIDEIHLQWPFYGSRRVRDELDGRGHTVNRKRVQRLMRLMDLRALYPRRRTSQPGKGHKIYPYLLRDLSIERANQAWASDICYIPMAKGFMYLVAIMDWHSRRVLSWRVSNTLDTEFCIEALEEALRRFGAPEIFNTDQGSQFTSEAFTGVLKDHGIAISMDGKGRWVDNVFVERLWRSVKYEDVYLRAYETPTELRAGLARYFEFYNAARRHSALDRRTPDAVYFDQADRELAA